MSEFQSCVRFSSLSVVHRLLLSAVQKLILSVNGRRSCFCPCRQTVRRWTVNHKVQLFLWRLSEGIHHSCGQHKRAVKINSLGLKCYSSLPGVVTRFIQPLNEIMMGDIFFHSIFAQQGWKDFTILTHKCILVLSISIFFFQETLTTYTDPGHRPNHSNKMDIALMDTALPN